MFPLLGPLLLLPLDNLEKILSDAGVLQAWSEEVCKEVAQDALGVMQSRSFVPRYS